ncbi:DNA-binding NarL/FixJ family response regulator [Rhodanobacter sp. ANJX3]|uniref:response regulator n=1 Tax=Rhodanobacter sp. ANJX3 TaxID=2723083 RepID=UPI0016112E44|nr:DNA-binding NarL/FixJ family response regulator [Rhodanobacter sp. ANJX3]
MNDRLVALIVEDDPGVRGTLVLFVESFPDVDILTAAGFQQASAMIATVARIDLLLCDVMLPGSLSGIDIAEAVAQTHPAAAIVIMSADPQEEIAGLTDRFIFMQKPFGIAELTDVIDNAFLRLRSD